MERLNVAFLFYARPHLGGSGIMSLELAKELAKKGHNIDIVSYPGTYLTAEEEELGLEIHPIENINYPCFKAEPYNATLASQVANLAKDKKIDIIHANYAITHGDAALTAREIIKRNGGDPKVVVTSHGSDIHVNGYHNLLAPSLEYTLSSADAITFVSQALQDEAEKILHLDNYGQVIYNFVDQDKFKPATPEERQEYRRRLEIPEEAFVTYHASNFRPIKQTHLLVESAQYLHQKGEDCYFLMVGDGPERAELENLVSNSGVGNKVRFVGRQDDVLPYLQAADAGVLCSSRESFGLALLEALACGLPGLGSNIGGIPEVIQHGKTGYLFKPGNVPELSNYIQQLAHDPTQSKAMGVAARECVESEFSRNHIVQQYETLYRKLL